MDNDIRLMLILGAVFTIRLMLEVLYQKGSLVKVVMTGKQSHSSKVYEEGQNPLLDINSSE